MTAHPDHAGQTDPSLRGEIVHLFAFDIAYEMRRGSLRTVLGRTLEAQTIDPRKKSPRGQVFFRPLVAALPDLPTADSPAGSLARVSIKVLPIGAISIMVRMPFVCDSPDQLASLRDPGLADGRSLPDRVREIAERARTELAAHAIRPRDRLVEGESYTVFCIDSDSPGVGPDASRWLHAHRNLVAGILTNEGADHHLSEQETAESTRGCLSYFQHDLVVADWDTALVIDRPGDFDEMLYIMELANVQLEELEAYDAFIDEKLENACRDLNDPGVRRRGAALKELKELRIDLARFSDELSNITKFFGEWHLARVYENISRIFHLNDWHRAIDEKLRTLDSLYEMFKQDQNHRIMLWLEIAIVMLFVIDVVMLLAGLAK